MKGSNFYEEKKLYDSGGIAIHKLINQQNHPASRPHPVTYSQVISNQDNRRISGISYLQVLMKNISEKER